MDQHLAFMTTVPFTTSIRHHTSQICPRIPLTFHPSPKFCPSFSVFTVCAHASPQPPNYDTSNNQLSSSSSIPPKRKRGRPKGSKNKKPSYSSYNPDTSKIRFPNGLSSSSSKTTQPDDFLQELLPLMAQEEVLDLEGESEDEADARAHIRKLMAQLSASDRYSGGQLKNLRPFALRDKLNIRCDACDGNGMVTCSYCDGEGFVDFGPNNMKYHQDFPNEEVPLPSHVMGNIYHCPICDCRTKEQCPECMGTGKVKQEGEGASKNRRSRYAARDDIGDMPGPVDIEKVLDEEGRERVEIGQDGLIILRAKPRKSGAGRPRKKPKEHEQKLEEEKQVKRKRGRPRKSIVQARPKDVFDEEEEERSVGVAPKTKDLRFRKTSVDVPTTDFVNTTDYKISRKLRNLAKRRTTKSENDNVNNDTNLYYEDNGDNMIMF